MYRIPIMIIFDSANCIPSFRTPIILATPSASTMSPPFITLPVEWHSARMGSMYNPDLTEEQRQMLANKWLSWYAADWSYARTTVIAFSAAVLFGLLLNTVGWLRSR